MTETNIHALNSVNLTSDRRSEFLNNIAASFDLYVQMTGEEPDALVAVMGGIKQSSRSSWLCKGETEGATTSMLALAHCVIGRDIYNSNAS